MHMRTSCGKDLEVRAERNRKHPTDWDLMVARPGEPSGFACGTLRVFDGKTALRYAVDSAAVAAFFKTELHPDLLRSSVRRAGRLVADFLAVEFVMET